MSAASLSVGWGHETLTPDQPVFLAGQFHARLSEGVMDPVTCTALALRASDGEHLVMVSLDLVTIADALRDAVRARLDLADLEPMKVVLNATHTHTAPECRPIVANAANVSGQMGVELVGMSPDDYIEFAADQIAAAVTSAWTSLEPGGVSFGLSHAVVGHNRRWTSFDGVSTMYGNTNTHEFSHIEGYEDHSVNLLAVYDADDKLTGLVVNVACPSQVSEGLYQVSADYWHDTRLELKQRLGDGLMVLGQCSAAGDQSPHHIVCKAAEQRMMDLSGRSRREEIAVRLADAVEKVLPLLANAIDHDPPMVHRVEALGVPRRALTEQDVADALDEAKGLRERYEAAMAELEANPAKREEQRWYVQATSAFRRARWCEAVAARFEEQQETPELPIEVHVVRLGDLAIATNPFEYYLDFGMQIKARSAAVQTIVVQLAGPGTYCPTSRAVSGKSYGAIPASTPVGPEGGKFVANRTVELIAGCWE